MGKDTISPSEIILVMNGGPPLNPNLEEAARGRRMHKQIEDNTKNGKPPELIRRLGVDSHSVDRRTNTLKKDIGGGLFISAIADLKTDDKVIEIKPGTDIRGHHLLQLGLTCVAASAKKGAVYLYDGDRLVDVPSGIEESTDALIGMARNARKILDTQEEIRLRPSLNGAAKQAMGAKSVKLRREMEVQYNIFMTAIKPNMKTYSR